MGVGMQIVYLGFAGSTALEREAGAQLVRLVRFSNVLTGCQLAIEVLGCHRGLPMYDARLDLITRAHGIKPMPHCSSADPQEAVQQAFDAAEHELEQMAASARHVK